jgi:hypothetical protein
MVCFAERERSGGKFPEEKFPRGCLEAQTPHAVPNGAQSANKRKHKVTSDETNRKLGNTFATRLRDCVIKIVRMSNLGKKYPEMCVIY